MDDCISYRDTAYFSDLICDYLGEQAQLRSFYQHFPHLENFEKQCIEKKENFPKVHREILVESLEHQYQKVETSTITKENIAALAKENTFTITTGHQLNLFSGPLYFLYKIVSVINLTKQLQEKHPDYQFVPVYWMATEDHDFEEINYFNVEKEKIQWKREAAGAVGELSTNGLSEVFSQFKNTLNDSDAAEFLSTLFEQAYLKHSTLADATFYLVNTLFAEYGLVCVDANVPSLKKLFVPQLQNELVVQNAYQNVHKQAEKLKELGYSAQVNPREINLFYLSKNLRERIIKEGDNFKVNNTEHQFTQKEILQEVAQFPERFSPNVVMRPLYQECILPNLCYIGGGGELAYWFELKTYFEAEKIPFPILLLRNSALLVSEKTKKKLDALEVSTKDLFKSQSKLVAEYTKRVSDIHIDFEPQKTHLQAQFKALYKIAEQTDKSFLGAVAAQEKKQLNGLSHLEKRLLTAQKKKLSDELERLICLQDQLFPGLNLQERTDNFSSHYMAHGKNLLPTLFRVLNPLEAQFKIIYI